MVGIYSHGQVSKQSCNCPFSATTKPDSTFHLSNGKTIVLCGYRDTVTIKGRTLFSEFVLATCGADSILGSWGAANTYQLRVVKDTLFVEEIFSLPVGKNLESEQTPWKSEQIYFVNGKSQRRISLNRNLRKYSASEIASVINKYESSEKLDEKNIEDVTGHGPVKVEDFS